jgi:CRP-like cAMP-binding protein
MERTVGLISRENWIGDLPPPVRDELVERCTVIDVAAGATLGRAGEPCPGLYQIVSGYLRLMGNQEDGRQVLITIYSAGNCFAETTVVARRAFNHTTVAMTDSRVRLLAAADFWALYQEHREIADALCHKFASAIGRQLANRELRASNRLGKRIALMLENLVAHCGEHYLDGSALIRLPITQTDIAEHFDVTRQSIQREMSALKDAGVISRQGELWLVRDKAKLSRY